MADFSEQCRKEIEGFASAPRTSSAGIVSAVGDGVAQVDGLAGARMSEMIRFDLSHGKKLTEALDAPKELFGVVLNLEEDSVRAVVLGDAGLLAEGMRVEATGEVLSIPVGEALIGRVVSPLGEALDGQG